MKFWLVICAILFVTAQFVFWIKQFLLPLPIAIFAGAFLAIASNYDRGVFTTFKNEIQFPIDRTATISQTASLTENDSPKLLQGLKD
jgi:hypothetical protein